LSGKDAAVDAFWTRVTSGAAPSSVSERVVPRASAPASGSVAAQMARNRIVINAPRDRVFGVQGRNTKALQRLKALVEAS